MNLSDPDGLMALGPDDGGCYDPGKGELRIAPTSIGKSFKKAVKGVVSTGLKMKGVLPWSGTKTVGVNAGGAIILGIGSSLGISTDSKGNVAFQATGSVGASSSFGRGVGAFIGRTNASDVKMLNGNSKSIGGTFTVPVYGFPTTFGGDFSTFSYSGKRYYGPQGQIGISLGSDEIHADRNYTVTGFSFNIYDPFN